MKPAMTIDEALEFADLWSKGITMYEGATGWRVVCMLLAEEVRRMRSAPSVDDAHAMGAKGGPAVEAERLAFEAWMRGHCWALSAVWDGETYRGTAEHGNYFCPRAMNTRQLWAAWRDRAALVTKQRKEPNAVE
jgi:hypothetical protein